MGLNLNQLEKADGQNKIPISNVSGILKFSSISTNDFSIVSNTIRPLPMVWADKIVGNGGVAPATPPSLPPGLSNNAVIIRQYDDLVRVWMCTNGTWAHVFDI